MIKKITGTNVFKKLPLKNTVKRCIVGMELAGIIGGTNASSVAERAGALSANAKPPIYAPRKMTKGFEIADSISNANRAIHAIKEEVRISKRQKSIVLKVMKEDENCAPTADKNKLAEKIVKIAKELDANPLHIACIAKQETHFTEHINRGAGSGIMQITSVVAKDMFLRPAFYDKNLEKITADFPDHRTFYRAIQKSTGLNIRVGVLLFQARLNEADGNLRKALLLYNGSRLKHQYAHEILTDIKKYEKILGEKS